MKEQTNTGANMRFAIGEAGRYCLERYKVEGETYYNEAKAKYNELLQRMAAGAIEPTADEAPVLFGFVELENLRNGIAKAKEQAQPIGADTLTQLLTAYGGNIGRWQLFTDLLKADGVELTREAMAAGLLFAYSTAKADKAEVLGLLLKAKREGLQIGEPIRHLPQTLTIYRGGNVSEQTDGYGLSWTLDAQIAAFFAYRAGDTNGQRVIFETRINKAEVLGFTDSRHEAEVLADINAKHPFPVSVIKASPDTFKK